MSHALKAATKCEIYDEVRDRDMVADMADDLEDDELVGLLQAKGIFPIINARPTKLIHELNRQAMGASVQGYYYSDGKDVVHHSGQKVGAIVTQSELYPYETRSNKRRKKSRFHTSHYVPRAITDYRVDVKDHADTWDLEGSIGTRED